MNSYKVFDSVRAVLMLGVLLAGCNKPMEREHVQLPLEQDKAPNGASAANTSSTAGRSPSDQSAEAAKEAPQQAATTRKVSDRTEGQNDAEITKAPRGNVNDHTPGGQSESNPAPAGGASKHVTSANVNDSAAQAAQIDPAIAAIDTRVDYLTLEIPPQSTTASWKGKQWIDQIALTDRAMRSLMLDQQASTISNADYMTQAKRLSELKLAASDQLKAVATNENDADLAILGKLEALSQFAQLGDRKRANELLAFANEHANFKSKAVARQASLVLLGFSLNQINSDSANPESLLQQIDAVLADRDKLRLPEFKMMEQVIIVLRRKNLPEVADRVLQKTIAAFANNPDANIAYSVWSESMSNNPTFQTVLGEIKKRPTEPELLKKAINDHIAADKTDWFMIWLSKEIKNLETDAAGAEIVTQTISNAKFASRSMSDVALEQVDAYSKHVKMIGHPLVLSELADVNGTALDLGALKGKVVLVLYWASWCPVCQAEIPNLSALYTELKPRGFEIVGVNVDDTESAMRGFTHFIEMPWPNYRSSNPTSFGFNTLAARQVGLNGTPFAILIDPAGNVVTLQLYGQPLKDKIESLLPSQ